MSPGLKDTRSLHTLDERSAFFLVGLGQQYNLYYTLVVMKLSEISHVLRIPIILLITGSIA